VTAPEQPGRSPLQAHVDGSARTAQPTGPCCVDSGPTTPACATRCPAVVPPTADSPTAGTGVCGCGLPRWSPVHGNPFGAGHPFRPAASSPVTPEPPAEPIDGWAHLTIPVEAKQDDEVRNSYRAAEMTGSVPLRRVITAALDEAEERGRRAALTARPSADTETLRGRVNKIREHYSSLTPTAPAATLAALLIDLRAALDGER